MPPTQRDLFFYNGNGIGVEDLAKYKPGGLHPILLGDVLPKRGSCMNDDAKQPRYRIAQKLGFGAFSTVWLARDLNEKRYVALKVCYGSDELIQSNETRILSQIHQTGRGKPGYNNVVEVYDIFTIRGPNGFHECLVTEVVLPLDSMSIQQKCPPHKAIEQVLRGFDFLHNEGLVHGDPHYANFSIAIPQFQQFDEGTIADYFADPAVITVVPRDPSFPMDSIPSYVAESVSLGAFLLDQHSFLSSEEICLKILDFGRASWANKIPKDLPGAAPPTIRPPEVYIYTLSDGKSGSIWSKEADIWAIGCIVYQIKTGCPLLLVQGDSQYQFYQALRLGGAPPKEWSKFWDLETFCESTKSWKQPVPPFFDTEQAWESRRPKFDPGSDLFLDLIRRMVTTEPTRRSKITQLLDHPFFSHVGLAEE